MLKYKAKDTPAILAVGLLGNGLPYILFAWALMHIDSSVGGITNSLTPLFTLIVGAIWFKIPLRRIQALGILIGLFGAIYMLNPSENTALGENWPYALLTVLASLMYAFGINTIQSKLQHLDSISITMYALTIVGIPSFIILFAFTDFLHLMQTDANALMSLMYVGILGILGTGLAIILFNYLIKKASALYAASITYLVPIVAMGWGMIDGEQMTIAHILGISAILTGVYFVNYKKRKKTAALK